MIILEQVKLLDGHSDLVETIAVSSLTDTIMTGGRDGKVLFWNSSSSIPIFSWVPYGGLELYHADMSDDASVVLACHSQYKEAILYDKITCKSRLVPLLEYCRPPMLSGDGRSIVSYSNNSIYRIHLSEHKGIEYICKTSSTIHICQYFRHRDCALVVNQKGHVLIVDLLSNSIRAVLPQVYRKIAFEAIFHDDSLIAIANKNENTIDLWKIELCSNRTLVEKKNSFRIPSSMRGSLFSNARIFFTDVSHAFVCAIPSPLSFVDFNCGEIQTFDGIGYCNNYFVDREKKLIYLPYGKTNGNVAVFSYRWGTASTTLVQPTSFASSPFMDAISGKNLDSKQIDDSDEKW